MSRRTQSTNLTKEKRKVTFKTDESKDKPNEKTNQEEWLPLSLLNFGPAEEGLVFDVEDALRMNK